MTLTFANPFRPLAIAIGLAMAFSTTSASASVGSEQKIQTADVTICLICNINTARLYPTPVGEGIWTVAIVDDGSGCGCIRPCLWRPLLS